MDAALLVARLLLALVFALAGVAKLVDRAGRVGLSSTSAVLLDSEGKVASELAVGAPAVWELARVRQTGS